MDWLDSLPAAAPAAVPAVCALLSVIFVTAKAPRDRLFPLWRDLAFATLALMVIGALAARVVRTASTTTTIAAAGAFAFQVALLERSPATGTAIVGVMVAVLSNLDSADYATAAGVCGPLAASFAATAIRWEVAWP